MQIGKTELVQENTSPPVSWDISIVGHQKPSRLNQSLNEWIIGFPKHEEHAQ